MFFCATHIYEPSQYNMLTRSNWVISDFPFASDGFSSIGQKIFSFEGHCGDKDTKYWNIIHESNLSLVHVAGLLLPHSVLFNSASYKIGLYSNCMEIVSQPTRAKRSLPGCICNSGLNPEHIQGVCAWSQSSVIQCDSHGLIPTIYCFYGYLPVCSSLIDSYLNNF